MSSNTQAGFAGQLETAAPGSAHPRQANRQSCGIGAGLRPRGATGFSARILDMSTHGFRALTPNDLAPGEEVWLKLPGIETLHAKVAWIDGDLIGCAFFQPLHPAVLQMMINR